MKKFLSLLLVLSLLALPCLTSCEMTPEALLEKAERALTESSYAVNIDVDISSGNDEIDELISSLGKFDLKMTVDGEDKLSLLAKLEGGYVNAEVNYTVIEEMAYLDATLSALGYTTGAMKAKSEVDENEIEELRDTLAVGTDITYISFESITLDRDEEGNFVITCQNVKSDAFTDLADMANSLFDNIDGKITAKDAELSLALKDGKYSKITLLCDYEIAIGGITETVTAKIVMNYEYGEHTKISAPKNENEYISVDFEELSDAINTFLK